MKSITRLVLFALALLVIVVAVQAWYGPRDVPQDERYP